MSNSQTSKSRPSDPPTMTTDPSPPEADGDSSSMSTSGDSPPQMNLFESLLFERFRAVLEDLSPILHRDACRSGFWDGPHSNADMATKMYLVASESHEAAEVIRKDPIAPSSKIPGFSHLEEECADVLIRLLDFAEGYDLRLVQATYAKLLHNRTRPHRHGKAF